MAKLEAVRVPDIGDFEAVEVIEVLVKPGDEIAAEDSLITLESDKASMEIPAPMAGTVKEVKINVGDKVSEGQVILLLESAAANQAETPQKTAESKPVTSAEEVTPAKEKPINATAEKSSELSTPSSQSESSQRISPTAHIDEVRFRMAHASPSVRRFARELGADLGRIRGSGPKGRVVKDDVKIFIKQTLSGVLARADAQSSTGFGLPVMPTLDFAKWGEIETKPLSRIKKLSGANLLRNWLNVPHVTHHDSADVTELEDFRQSLKAEAEQRGLRITALTFIIKAVAAGLRKYPQFNSSLANDGQNLIYKKYFHVGIAVDTPNGLVVPVLRDVERKSIFELAAEMADVSQRARDGKLKAEEMQGGCISISSLGGIGGTAFTPIINAPEVAILGVTRASMQPVWNGKEFTPRLLLPLDLSYDHRVIDGAEAARFMAYLCQALGDVRRLLL